MSKDRTMSRGVDGGKKLREGYEEGNSTCGRGRRVEGESGNEWS